MPILRSRIIISFLTLITFSSTAQKNSITVYADSIVNTIPYTLFGSCIEDVNHEIYGGLYDQKLIGESFEEPASGINYRDWTKSGGYWFYDREYGDSSISMVPGRHNNRMFAKNEINVSPDGSARIIYTAKNINDGDIETELKFLEVKGTGGSVLLRTSNVGIAEDLAGYEVRLNIISKTVQLIKHQTNSKLLREQIADFSNSTWNKLKINLDGQHISIFLNNGEKPVIDYFDNDHPILKGNIGLAIADAPVSFRHVHVSTQNLNLELPLIYSEKQQISERWDPISSDPDNTIFSLIQEGAFNGLSKQVIEQNTEKGKSGISNSGLNHWGIAVENGQRFTGSCFLYSDANSLPVTISLESGDGKIIYDQKKVFVNSAGWKEYDFNLTSNTTDSMARFAIYFEQKGKLYIDQVSLMTTRLKRFKGLPMRADIGNAIIQEGLTFMRYGGSMVNAPGYRFKNMIGPRAARQPYTGTWNEYSSNGFGIEDFLQLTEAAGIQSAFAINIEESAKDAADMVEYLNGDTNTFWGNKRAVFGHPKPYHIKYIEIGNEEVMFEGDDSAVSNHYADRFLDLYRSIHSKDSSIKLVCAAWWRPESANTEKLFRAIDGKAAYWDLHVDADDRDAGFKVDSVLTTMQKRFLQWNPSTTMKCAIFEENGGLHNMQRALGHATILNAVRRHGDFVLTSCAANALQPYLQNDNGWDQGQIFFTPNKVWGMPPFYATQMASLRYAPLRIKDQVEGKLDITSTKSKDGQTLIIHVVNIDSVSKNASIILNQFSKIKRVQTIVLRGDLDAVNLPGDFDHITPKKNMSDKPLVQFTFPPQSYVIIKIER